MSTGDKLNFSGLIDEVRKEERRSKRRALWVTVITVLLALGLITYTSTKVTQASTSMKAYRDSTVLLSQKIQEDSKSLKKLKDSLENLSILIERYDLDFKKFIDIKWVPSVSLDQTPEGLRLSESSHEALVHLLKVDTVNVRATVRYYIKRSEQDKVKNSLRGVGFRDLYIINDSYRLKKPTNSIQYSPGIGRENVLAVALALMRSGVHVKVISPYPERVITKHQKDYSIEISCDEAYLSARALSMEEVLSFEYRSK